MIIPSITEAVDIWIEYNLWTNYDNLNTGNIKSEWQWAKWNTHLKNLWEWEDGFIDVVVWWEKWIYYTLVKAAKDLKNIFYAIAWVYLLVLVLKLLFLENTEEEVWKFKKWVLWTTIWIIVMQIAFGFVNVLYDQGVNESLAVSFLDNIINPLIALLETAASLFFLAIAIFTFFRMVTSSWDEEKAKKWKWSIVYAIVWFAVIKLSKGIVEAAYWKINPNCETSFWFDFVAASCLEDARIEGVSKIITDVINWVNWFIWIVVLIMVIYAWSLVLLSAWDEEKLKKAKSIMLYVAIWMFLLVINYLILTFFIYPEVAI